MERDSKGKFVKGSYIRLDGKQFGYLTVLQTTRENNKTYCTCLCSCGNKVKIRSDSLKNRTSCGCKRIYPENAIDISGKVFGELTVIKKNGKNNYGGQNWLCRCSCGTLTTVRSHDIIDGNTTTCGGRIHIIKHGDTKHVGKKSRIYSIWCAMKSRCSCKANERYENYGGRGIKVCDEWKNSYIAFKEWSLLHGYSDELTIDRINVNGNYEPSNCRWATENQQANNKTNNHRVTINGTTHTISEWCKIIGINTSIVNGRIYKGWIDLEALTIPKGGKRQ